MNFGEELLLEHPEVGLISSELPASVVGNSDVPAAVGSLRVTSARVQWTWAQNAAAQFAVGLREVGVHALSSAGADGTAGPWPAARAASGSIYMQLTAPLQAAGSGAPGLAGQDDESRVRELRLVPLAAADGASASPTAAQLYDALCKAAAMNPDLDEDSDDGGGGDFGGLGGMGSLGGMLGGAAAMSNGNAGDDHDTNMTDASSSSAKFEDAD